MVTITEEPLTLEQLLAVVAGEILQLDTGARARIAASRAVVDEVLRTGAAVYGLTTGVGHLKDTRVPDDELRAAQQMLLTTHAGGFGPPLPTEVVRAAMAARVVGITRGGSGASPRVADVLVEMLNAGVHPVVPSTASVGAGDLPSMAAIGLVAIGLGAAELAADVVPGGEALRRAGIEPLALEPKDGLALMSANGISIGHGALVVARAERLADAADLAAVFSLEAVAGNASIVAEEVAAAKPFPGQVAACARLRSLLHGSSTLDPAAAHSVQDALSFRVVPQVHGAMREFVAFTRRAVEVELNSRSDNPLADADSGAIVHNGNFHPAVLALAFDSLRPALAHVGRLSDRRMSHLWNAFFAALDSGGPPPGDGPPRLPGVGLRYPAAAAYPTLHQLAPPATLDVGPLSGDLEDHATSAPLTVSRTAAALDVLADLLAVELLLARDALLTSGGAHSIGVGGREALALVDRALGAVEPAATPGEVHAALRAMWP